VVVYFDLTDPWVKSNIFHLVFWHNARVHLMT
jgi:hypothetical protein